MRQRASLCRAIVHRPEVLILDEPFGALDAFTREDLWQTMHQVKAEEPFTGVLITHDLRESIYLADQVVVLSGRPARTQFVMDVHLGPDRDIEDLYTPESAEALKVLRHQIRVAHLFQGLGHQVSFRGLVLQFPVRRVAATGSHWFGEKTQDHSAQP
jgi:NitT/TauT family transport system ATP-binding protein